MMLSHDNEINQQSDRDDVFGSLEVSVWSGLYDSSRVFLIRRLSSLCRYTVHYKKNPEKLFGSGEENNT